MQVNATNTAVEPRPLAFAGLPATSWAFAIRTWLAVILALYASFWLELEAPSSAAITVAIIALPTRGQAMEKAGFRLIATVIGVAASIAIAGFFSQTDGLLLAVFSGWIGLCVYAAGMLDGNRAYAAALCCVTVALIAVQQIDSPQLVFTAGVARGAAIAVGVVASALINDLLAVPDYHPILSSRLEEYVKAHFDRCISLPDLAKVAGLSRMHFAAQLRAATGYRPREYLLHQRIEHAKSLLSKTETPLAEVALAVGFCTQAHFSTVFKRITSETPARWRCASKNELPSAQSPSQKPTFGRQALALCHAGELA
jgi:AraC-like DNA-binding protein